MRINPDFELLFTSYLQEMYRPLGFMFVALLVALFIKSILNLAFFPTRNFHDIEKKRNTTLSNDYLESLAVYEESQYKVSPGKKGNFKNDDMPTKKEFHNDYIPLVVTSVVVADLFSDSSSSSCDSSSSNDCGGFE